jgi:hypothetical protein
VNDTAGPVRFYHFNPEHSVANANSEFRGSHDISVFGTKSEGHSATLWVRDCTDVFHSGHAGAGNAFLEPLLHQNMITLPRQARDKDKEVERTGVLCRQRQPLAVRPRDLPDLAAVTLRMQLDRRAAVAVPRRELPRQL